MRMTLDIDDALIEALMTRQPGVSKAEAVERAVRAYLADDAVTALRAMAGTVEIEDVSAELRRIDRRS